jgi:hypothetical protein
MWKEDRWSGMRGDIHATFERVKYSWLGIRQDQNSEVNACVSMSATIIKFRYKFLLLFFWMWYMNILSEDSMEHFESHGG